MCSNFVGWLPSNLATRVFKVFKVSKVLKVFKVLKASRVHKALVVKLELQYVHVYLLIGRTTLADHNFLRARVRQVSLL